jgi:hypothetical protein
MTEAEWLAGGDPRLMLELLHGNDRFEETGDDDEPRPMPELVHDTFSERKLRLYAVACCRRDWDSLTDERSREAVEMGEWFADGRATREEVGRAREAASAVVPGGPPPYRHRDEYAALCAFHCALADQRFPTYNFSHQIVHNLSCLTTGDWKANLVP